MLCPSTLRGAAILYYLSAFVPLTVVVVFIAAFSPYRQWPLSAIDMTAVALSFAVAIGKEPNYRRRYEWHKDIILRRRFSSAQHWEAHDGHP